MNTTRTVEKDGRAALALIVVVYVLAGLGTLAFALAFRSRLGLCQAQLLLDRLQQDQMALAARAQAGRLLAVDDPNVDSYDDRWAGWHILERPQDVSEGAGADRVWWRLMDESAKVNVNLSPSDVLARLAGLDQAAVASILDWIDKDDVPNPDGAEKEYYASLSPAYICRNGPLESVEELAFIKGITPERYFGTLPREPPVDLNDPGPQPADATEEEGTPGLGELLTIYGDGRINLNTAPAAVLRTLPLLSEAAVKEILAHQQPRARKFTTVEDIRSNDVFNLMDKIVLLQVGKFNSRHFLLQIRIGPEGTFSVCEYAAILERDNGVVQPVRWQRRLPPVGSDDLYEAAAPDPVGSL
jgi:type II secretory pathway component PulK